MSFLELYEQSVKKEEKEPETKIVVEGEQKEFCVEDAISSLKDKLNIEPLLAKAEGYSITSQAEAEQALSMSMQSRKLKKSLESSRKGIIQPHVDFQRAINKIVKDYTTKLEEIEDNLKQKLESWIESKEESNSVSEISLVVEDGTLKQTSVWTYELDDLSKVPREYLMLDDKKVKDKIKKGIREIEGIKIYEKQSVNMRIK